MDAPVYDKFKGRVWYSGVYDWERHATDGHDQGPSIMIFDTDVVEIQEVIEVNY